MSLSLINSNSDFAGRVIKTSYLLYFRIVKFHYVEETRDGSSLLVLVKFVGASQHKR